MGVRLRQTPEMLAVVSEGRVYGYRIIRETDLPGVLGTSCRRGSRRRGLG
jgi:hypothetical protein